MKSIKKAISIIILTLLSIFALIIVTFIVFDIIVKPTSDRYITGRIYGNTIELMNTRFSFSTFDENGSELREGEINIYNMGKFVLSFTPEEKSFYIYESNHSYSETDENIINESFVFPNVSINIDKYNKQKINYIQNTFYLNTDIDQP